MTTKPKAKKYRIRRSDNTAATARVMPASEPVETPASNTSAAPSPKPAAKGPGIAQATPEQAVEQMFSPAATDDGFGGQTFPTRNKNAAESGPKAPTAKPDSGEPQSVGDKIDAIRREGLTGRQLRMARRVAQKQGPQPHL